MVKFTAKETKFIKNRPEARVATVSKKGWPQVTTVIHVFDGKNIYFATDYGTKKLENIQYSNKIALVIDVYGRQPKSVSIQGIAEILEKGEEFHYAYKLLQERHAYYRANPFKEGEAPIIKVMPVRKSSSL